MHRSPHQLNLLITKKITVFCSCWTCIYYNLIKIDRTYTIKICKNKITCVTITVSMVFALHNITFTTNPHILSFD